MNTTLSATKARYLAGVRAELTDLSVEDRDDVVVDLEAHLAELDDNSIEDELGDPSAFAAEFRRSAGLEHRRSGRWTVLPELRRRAAGRMTDSSWWPKLRTRWAAFRPAWIWVRAWLLVAVLVAGSGSGPFLNFPIPNVAGNSLAGLVTVIGATWLSRWLDRPPTGRWRARVSALFSVAAGLALFVSIVMPISPDPVYQYVEADPSAYIDQLTAPDGTPIENIYAFDLDGNPLEVLLFDQNGRPLRSLPDHIYQDAESYPQDYEIATESGAVRFQRDSFGRIVPNLYPLDLLRYNDQGLLTEMAPPSLGFPDLGDPESSATEPTAPAASYNSPSGR